MSKNIEINYKISDGYEVLYPSTLLANVTDWSASIYSKSEIDSKISTINNGINNAQMNPGGWENLGKFNGNTGNVGQDSYTNVSTVKLDKRYKYWVIINFVCTMSFNGSYYVSIAIQPPDENAIVFWYLGANSNDQCTYDKKLIYSLRYGMADGYYDTSGSQWFFITGRPYKNTGVVTGEELEISFTDSSNGAKAINYRVNTYSQNGTTNITTNNITFYRRKINNLS